MQRSPGMMRLRLLRIMFHNIIMITTCGDSGRSNQYSAAKCIIHLAAVSFPLPLFKWLTKAYWDQGKITGFDASRNFDVSLALNH